jgi:hypothetical protein
MTFDMTRGASTFPTIELPDKRAAEIEEFACHIA